MSAVLRAEGLVRRLEGEVPVTLVDGVSLEIERGQFVAIMGPSGSGKSSLLYLLGLIDMPTTGRIWLDGEETTAYGEDELADRRLRKLGFVFQFHFLLPEFTARENVEIPMRKLGRLGRSEMRGKASELLAALGLADHLDKRPDQLSGGQRQRVAVARALANDPPLILADEPTGSLDSTSSEQVFRILETLVREEGKTVVAVTHDLDMAARMDRRLHLIDGHLTTETINAARQDEGAAPEA